MNTGVTIHGGHVHIAQNNVNIDLGFDFDEDYYMDNEVDDVDVEEIWDVETSSDEEEEDDSEEEDSDDFEDSSDSQSEESDEQ